MSVERTNERRLDLDRIERKLAELERKKKRILDAIENLGFRNDLGDRLKIVDSEIAEAESKVHSAQSDVAALGAVDVNALAQEISAFFADFDKWDRQRQKEGLNKYVERLVVTNTEHGIEVVPEMKVAFPQPYWQADDPFGAMLKGEAELASYVKDGG